MQLLCSSRVAFLDYFVALMSGMSDSVNLMESTYGETILDELSLCTRGGSIKNVGPENVGPTKQRQKMQQDR